MVDDLFLIEKRGLYYRPESRGYTGLKREAGRYSFDDAAEIVGPNGPDGPQDGMAMLQESEAPEYSQSCAWDVRMKDEAYRKGKAESADEIARLRAQLAAFKEATTASADTKVAYWGEVTCESNLGPTASHAVPWSSTKQIMRMIRTRAEQKGGGA